MGEARLLERCDGLAAGARCRCPACVRVLCAPSAPSAPSAHHRGADCFCSHLLPASRNLLARAGWPALLAKTRSWCDGFGIYGMRARVHERARACTRRAMQAAGVHARRACVNASSCMWVCPPTALRARNDSARLGPLATAVTTLPSHAHTHARRAGNKIGNVPMIYLYVNEWNKSYVKCALPLHTWSCLLMSYEWQVLPLRPCATPALIIPPHLQRFYAHTHTHSLSLSLSQAHTHTLSLKHTHTHTHTHTCRGTQGRFACT